MIEEFVSRLIEKEIEIIDEMTKSLPEDGNLNSDKITRSRLSEFTKNYITSILEEPYEPDDVRDRIIKSNKLRFNYAIRPKWTLLTYLFGSYESRPPSEIIKKLEVFPFYNFYIDSINDLLKDNFSIFITRNEVSLLIDETNKAIYRKLTSEINNAKIKNFFLQVYQLRHGEQDMNLESTIPYSFIKIFLNDKYYFDIEKKFQLVNGINDYYEISLKDVIKVLMNKYDIADNEQKQRERITQEALNPEPPEPGAKIVNQQIEEEREEQEESAEPVPIVTDITAVAEEEEEENTAEDNDNEIIEISETVEEEDGEEVALQTEEDDEDPETLKEEEHSSVFTNGRATGEAEKFVNEEFEHEEPANEELEHEEFGNEELQYVEEQNEFAPKRNRHEADIKKLFSEKQFEKILEKVYRSDFENVAKSFKKLGNFKTWFEASNHLKDVFKANEVDIYNRDVVTFVDILNDYYTQRG